MTISRMLRHKVGSRYSASAWSQSRGATEAVWVIGPANALFIRRSSMIVLLERALIPHDSRCGRGSSATGTMEKRRLRGEVRTEPSDIRPMRRDGSTDGPPARGWAGLAHPHLPLVS